ncbi:hypothetical protein RIF29_27238 [Crotalaria pallida]|uniref:Uncharacterized protein n=1 Tax=Crotalaria pallida TaxID=3830 RepID=A0AAN9EP81_CROPI
MDSHQGMYDHCVGMNASKSVAWHAKLANLGVALVKTLVMSFPTFKESFSNNNLNGMEGLQVGSGCMGS